MTPAVATTPEPDDDESMVVHDDEPAAPVALCATSQAYLRAQGITDARTWSAFHVDAVTDADLERLLTLRQRAHLSASGLWLPTFDPRDPAHVSGLIRLSPAQHQHRFLSAPSGLAAPQDLTQQPRVVLVDHPLVALRLYERGLKGVAIVEDPAVLVPLTPWLAQREVVTITTAKCGELILPSSITPIGTGRICGSLEHASSATLTLLGLDLTTLRQPLTPLPLDLRAVRDLHAYAQRQVSTAAGMAALAACDLDQPDVVRAYRVGYLPADVRQAFTPDQRRMFLGRDLGGCVVFPADDEHGAVVDLMVMKAHSTHQQTTLWDTARGLCAATLSTAFDRVVVTTKPRWVGRLFREVGPTMLLRGVGDARAHAPRLAAGGVREVELRCRLNDESEQIAAILHAVGITVRVVHDPSLKREPPRRSANVVAVSAVMAESLPSAATVETPSSMPEVVSTPTLPSPPLLATTSPTLPTLILVSHDAQTEQAVFSYGPATYTVHVPWGTNTTAAVMMMVGAATHRDRFDLAVIAQRLRFASSAGLRTKLPSADIARALELMLPAVQKLMVVIPAEVTPKTVTTGMSDADRAAAMALLRDPTLMEQITATCDALGWIGESDAKLMIVLAAISRLGDEPVWAALTSESISERFPALGILAAITPPEHVLHISRLTDNALFHGDREALCHKLLILDDLSSISRAAATALRVLHAQGVLNGTQVERDPLRGGLRTRVVQARGPLAMITASATGIPTALAQHVMEVAIDESPDQSARLFAARQRMPVDAMRAVTRLINAQRLLRPLPVTVPSEIAVPIVISRHRSLHAPFFGLVAASALLHQFQRPALDGRLIATASDVALAQRAVLPLVGQVITGLGARARSALAALTAKAALTCTVADVASLMPGWSTMTARRAVDDLVAAGCLITERRRNGVVATFRRVDTAVGTGDLFSFSPPFQPTCEALPAELAHG